MGGKGKNLRGQSRVGKRHQAKNVTTPEKGGISMIGIRRLAKRGGVKRISSTIYGEIHSFIDSFLNNVLKDSANLA